MPFKPTGQALPFATFSRPMKNPRYLIAPALAALAAGAFLSTSAQAELTVGAAAPAFVTQGAKAGKPFTFDLKKALKKGPVVVYFYPKAFTKGCTLEAHAFAEATADFDKAGAMVIGLSADDLPTLEKFSTMECRDKFPVAIADAGIIKSYDVALSIPGISAAVTKRTSYVIGQDGKVKLAFTDMDYKDHVAKTLATVQGLAHKH
jgi:thioredoxin-dependent peroxiredoxin